MVRGTDCRVLVTLGPTGLTANPWSMARVVQRFAQNDGAVVSIMVSGDVQVVSAKELHEALSLFLDFLTTALLDPADGAGKSAMVYRADALKAVLQAAACISELTADGLAPGAEFARRMVICFLTRVAERHMAGWKWSLSAAPDGVSDVRRWPKVMKAKTQRKYM